MSKGGLPGAVTSPESSNSKTEGMGCRICVMASFSPASVERGCVKRDHCGSLFIPLVDAYDTKQVI